MFKSAVYLSIYRGGGLDPLQTNFRANPANLANNRSTKLGTLNCSAHVWTVRPTGADRPDRGPSGLRAGPFARSKWDSTLALGDEKISFNGCGPVMGGSSLTMKKHKNYKISSIML
jgi:hypothetical protein